MGESRQGGSGKREMRGSGLAYRPGTWQVQQLKIDLAFGESDQGMGTRKDHIRILLEAYYDRSIMYLLY